jgi:hypothetical protein
MRFLARREARPVAIGWEHPRDPGRTARDGTHPYRELWSRDSLAAHQERQRSDPSDPVPDPADYMPGIPEGTPYGWILYGTHERGIPLSPVFGSLEELAEWAETSETIFAGETWTRDQWLAAFRAGGQPVFDSPLEGLR